MNYKKIVIASGIGFAGVAIAYYLYLRRTEKKDALVKDPPKLADFNQLLKPEHFECAICWNPVCMSCTPACGHAMCGACNRNIIEKGVNQNCAFCRKPLPNDRRKYDIEFHQLPDGVEPTQEELNYCLHQAVSTGNLELSRTFLEVGAQVDSDPYGSAKPIFFAAVHGHKEIFELLLEYGANPLGRDTFGRTLLHGAARSGQVSILETLLTFDFDINDAQNAKAEAPIHSAVANGSWGCVMLLVSMGANINAKTSDGATPLIIAGTYNRLKIFNWLFLHPDTKIGSKDGLVFWCARGGSIDILKYLDDKIDILPSVPQAAPNPLYIAADIGNTEVLEFFLEKGVHPDIKNHADSTALVCAALKGHLPCVKVLCEHGADVNIRNCDQISPLLCSIQPPENTKAMEIFKYLIHHGADFKTPIEVSPFPEHAPDLFIRQSYLQSALKNRNIEAARFLLENGADVDFDLGKGMTLLHIACLSLNIDAVRLLCEFNANPEPTTENGYVPMQFALLHVEQFSSAAAEIVSILKTRGASTNVQLISNPAEVTVPPAVEDIPAMRLNIMLRGQLQSQMGM